MPNRILRDFTDSEAVNYLSIAGETCFTRLMMKADDFGKLYANEKLLKAALFPLRDIITEKDIAGYLIEMEKSGLIKLYEVNGKKYLKIKNFGQRLRKMVSKFPDPPTIDRKPPPTDSNTPPEEKRREGKGNEEESETESETEYQNLPNTEKFYRQSVNDEGWRESVMRTCKINNPVHWINEFQVYSKATQEHHNTITDWRRHCVHWIKNELRKLPEQPKPTRVRRDATHG